MVSIAWSFLCVLIVAWPLLLVLKVWNYLLVPLWCACGGEFVFRFLTVVHAEEDRWKDLCVGSCHSVTFWYCSPSYMVCLYLFVSRVVFSKLLDVDREMIYNYKWYVGLCRSLLSVLWRYPRVFIMLDSARQFIGVCDGVCDGSVGVGVGMMLQGLWRWCHLKWLPFLSFV